MVQEGEELVVARGGRGGRGNAAFASATYQTPRVYEEGEPGEQRRLKLKLKLLADVGLIGLPNAGKSTLISRISAARPKIAAYPFTTLRPYLGMVVCDDFRSFVVADIPGLLPGAHKGVGLGDRFLRHVERTRLLLHLIDVSEMAEGDPVEGFRQVNRELEAFSPELAAKPQIVVPTKLDVADAKRLRRLVGFCQKTGVACRPVSAVTGQGVGELVREVAARLVELAGRR